MPYPDKLYRCNIGAVTPGEQIVNTLWVRLDDTTAVTPDLPQTIANQVRDAWAKFILGGNDGSLPQNEQFAGGTAWDRVTCYPVNALGKATAVAEATFGPTVKGSESFALPAQTALVVTTLTGSPGRSARGRMYLGGLGRSILGGDGRLTAPRQTAITTAFGKFLVAVRSRPNLGDLWRPVVVSPTTGTARKITAITVGDLTDTMRSRRTSLREIRASAVVDAS
jgi:hypothetical protein